MYRASNMKTDRQHVCEHKSLEFVKGCNMSIYIYNFFNLNSRFKVWGQTAQLYSDSSLSALNLWGRAVGLKPRYQICKRQPGARSEKVRDPCKCVCNYRLSCQNAVINEQTCKLQSSGERYFLAFYSLYVSFSCK